MKKYSIILILLISELYCGLISCNKTDSPENNLVGIWESTKIDTLTQYITPAKPGTFRSVNYTNCSIEINDDGSFRMVDSKDTIIGTWNQNKTDSLKLTVNNTQGNYPYNSKIEFIDRNNLTLNYSAGFVHYELGPGYRLEEITQYDIKVYYTRKQ